MQQKVEKLDTGVLKVIKTLHFAYEDHRLVYKA